MALKKKITKDEFEKLNEAFKTEYVADGDGFRLDIEGEEDTGALKRAKDREAQEKAEAKERVKELEKQLSEIEGNDARKKGDIATLEKSWQKKLDAEKAVLQAQISKLTETTTKNLVDNVAKSISAKLTGSDRLLYPHIKARLSADFEGDEPKTRILDSNGKPSALTLEDLEKEFVADKDFSAIIKGSKASGSAGKPSGSAGNPLNNSDKPADLSTANPRDFAAMLKEKKASEQDA